MTNSPYTFSSVLDKLKQSDTLFVQNVRKKLYEISSASLENASSRFKDLDKIKFR